MVDETSGSASEQIAAGLQEAKRAFIVGKTTKGADLDSTSVGLPIKALFLYPYGQPRTPKGVVIEGRGVIPDREVNLTRKDLLMGRDAQLEAAIDYVKNGNQQSREILSLKFNRNFNAKKRRAFAPLLQSLKLAAKNNLPSAAQTARARQLKQL